LNSNYPGSLEVNELSAVHVLDGEGNACFCVSVGLRVGQPVLSILEIGTTNEQPECVSLRLIRQYLDAPFRDIFPCSKDNGQPIPILVESADPINRRARLRPRNGNAIRSCNQPHVH
jgi:hypothetical protein